LNDVPVDDVLELYRANNWSSANKPDQLHQGTSSSFGRFSPKTNEISHLRHFASGLMCFESGGSRTPVELFVVGVAMLDLDVCRQIDVFSVSLANDFVACQ